MLLVDTHVLLWLADGNPRLGAQARGRVLSSTAVHYSAASIWELTIKQLLGKLSITEDFEQGLQQAGLVELPVTARHARAIAEFPSLLKHDPFDRLLLGQASADRLTLLTADAILLAVPGAPVADARR